MTFIHDKPLIEDVFNYDVIVFGTGIHNALGNGVQYDMKINFPVIEETIKKTPYADPRKLGTVSVINSKPIFCVGFIHQGGYRKDVLLLVDENFKDKQIAMPLIGCSQFDGNGDKNKVLEIIDSLNNNDYFVYDYHQRDYREINNEKWFKITEMVGKIPYEELRRLKDEYIKIRKYGIHGAKKIK